MLANRLSGLFPAWAAGACLLVGALLSVAPYAAAATTGAVFVTAVALRRGSLLSWDIFAFVLGGSLVLGYGFSNVGLARPFPIPLTDILLALLLIGMLTSASAIRPSLSLLAAGGFMLWGYIRLVHDLPTWGGDALRDSTLPLEFAFLFVGAWMVTKHGVDRLVRVLTVVFGLALVYFAFFPWGEEFLAQASPTVGLQRPVPLLGSFAGAGPAAVAGFFFFLIVRPVGRLSLWIALLFIPEILLFQSRGVYLAVAGATLTLFLLRRKQRLSVAGGVAAFAVAIVLLVAVGGSILPEGRFGPVSIEVMSSQLGTLVGQEGAGEGTFQHRLTWFREIRASLSEAEFGLLVGLGFGPDLASGFELEPGLAVRKPHNDYLEITARMGLLGLSLFLVAIGGILARIVAHARGDSQYARLTTWIATSSVVYLMIAATQPLLAFPYGTVPLFALLGAGLAIASEKLPREATITRHAAR